MNARLVMLSFALVACGAPRAPAPVEPDPAGGGLSPDDPSLEVDPQPCTTDDDCMIGTPRGCCTSFCPTDQVAWSRARWAEYQSDCAETECATTEDLACLPETPAALSAVCEDERCVLR
jgi:hypothetical protein